MLFAIIHVAQSEKHSPFSTREDHTDAYSSACAAYFSIRLARTQA